MAIIRRASNRSPYLDTLPREPLTPTADLTPQWRLYLEAFQKMLGSAGGIAWAIISKRGSRLSDIDGRPHSDLQNVYGSSTIAITSLVPDKNSEVLHVSRAQTEKWDANSSNSNVLTWLIGG